MVAILLRRQAGFGPREQESGGKRFGRGWSFNPETNTIDIQGHDFASTKKFRDVLQTGRATIVIDDVLPPWQPRGIEIRGEAEAIVGPPALIRIQPRRIVSWGIDNAGFGGRNARNVR